LSHAASRQHRFAGAVLDPVDIDFDFVTDLEVGLLARRGELAQRHAALALQTHVDHRQVILDPSDRALHHLAFERFILAAEALVEKGREIVAGREGRGRHKVVVSRTFKSACRAAPPWRGSNMRTWFNALPLRAHPETASCRRLRWRAAP
jgi:hypothetical protein